MRSARCPNGHVLVTSLLACALLACSVDEGANSARRCEQARDCERGERCYRGFCIAADGGSSVRPPDAGPDPDAAMVDAGDAAAPPQPCADEGEEDFCYTGPAGTELVGRCVPGKRVCRDGVWGPCEGQVKPASGEVCNAIDDDCDGSLDEDAELGSCDTRMQGECMRGALMCLEGGGAVCEQQVLPGVETCDGKDNDCDGEIDEGDVAQASCYDEDAAGCVDGNGDGVFECSGICKAGVRACEGGATQACDGMMLPAEREVCDSPEPGELSLDEDCDGQVDEGCDCEPGDMRNCYSGPAGTAGLGECTLGVQSCTSGTWGPCADQVVPVPETCMNLGADDDCNGIMDDIPGRNTACTDEAQMGRCRVGMRDCRDGMLTCVTPEPREETCDSTDDDCEGGVDEGFDLFSDEQNCGVCGEACDEGETCCGGQCYDTTSDEQHCGDCGIACGQGETCCEGQCVDTMTDTAHCGGCDMACPGGEHWRCCSGGCADTTASQSHCGGCGIACAALTSCCRTSSGRYQCALVSLCL